MALLSKINDYVNYANKVNTFDTTFESKLNVKICCLTLYEYLILTKPFYKIYQQDELLGYVDDLNYTLINDLKGVS